MTGQSDDVGYPSLRRRLSRSDVARRRFGQALLILSIVLVLGAGLTAWALYNRPAHHYAVGANGTTWSSDVKFAIRESGSGSPVNVVGPLKRLPGVGKIVEVVVDGTSPYKKVVVLFLTGVGVNDAGLAYLDGYPPPPDSCSVHLSGPWWELSPLNDATMACARGFHYTSGG